MSTLPTLELSLALARRSPRLPAHGHALIRVCGLAHSAEVENLSREGIGLIMKKPMSSGATASARIYFPGGERSCTRSLRVVHSTPRLGGSYLVGCEFTSPIGWEELQVLLA